MALATHPIGKTSRWAASASVDRASADVTNTANTVHGDVTMLEGAGNYQWEAKTIRVDAAAGVAVPIGVGADPWPEAKLAARWRPSFGPLELVGTLARKGRVPSLRERFEPGGNAALGPELASHAELRTIYDIKGGLRIEVAPYYKRTTGTVRASTDPADMGMLVNLGELTFYGVDTQLRVPLRRHGWSHDSFGGAYGFIHVDGETENPIDRLPAHRAELWYEATFGPRVTAIARGRYFGESIDRTMTVPNYFLIELTATAKLSDDYLAVLRVDDLTNERPETRSGYFAPGRLFLVSVQGQWQ
jgi:outer membrane receptor protein involved in Fe transport